MRCAGPVGLIVAALAIVPLIGLRQASYCDDAGPRSVTSPPKNQPPAGNIESLVIADGNSAKAWQVTEATIGPGNLAAPDANCYLLFHVPVDWEHGEPKYPIGWPRCWRPLPKDQQDWSKWDRLTFRVFTKTTRDKLPAQPLALILGGGKHAWSRELSSLVKDQWVDFDIPLDDLSDRQRVTEIKLAISEAHYRHGDIVEFFIGPMELRRYTQPTVVAFQPPQIAFADDPALPVALEVLGLPKGQKAKIEIRLQKDGKTLTVCRDVPGGRSQAAIALPKALPCGDYKIVARCGGCETAAKITLVASPWQEGSKQ